MNVKANKILMDLPEVEKIFVYPSCGDESNAAGVCYNLAARFRAKEIEPLGPVYFGISFSSGEVERSFKNYTFKHSYSISKPDNIEKSVAQLLAEGYVVARFKNREEFGARSLGNRAILANPVKPDVIKEINEMIKNRDFWMPFASSMLDTDMDKYLTWQSSKNSPDYMIMTYDTRAEHQKEIAGGIHPYDKTVRPQRVSKEHNADYWNLINEFKQITGIGSIVNTSLNLHGLPLVHSPEDAFHVLENSSLKFLAIEDYLITKNN
jgi:carbamoyltransferase